LASNFVRVPHHDHLHPMALNIHPNDVDGT